MSDFTNPQKIHECLGDYWYSIYYSNEQIGNYVASICFNREQWDYQFKDTKDCLSRYKVPIFEHVKIKPVYLKYSDALESIKDYPTYNGKFIHNGSIQYDLPIGYTYKFKIPEDIKSAGYIANKVVDPTYTSKAVIKDGMLYLDYSPFSGIFKLDRIYDEAGRVVDSYAIVWLFDVELEKEDIYYQYGYIFNIHFDSSENYKQLINVLYDSLINGPSERVFRLYISTVTGIPVALTEGEIVTEVLPDLVTTDKNKYYIHCEDVPVVNVGDVLSVGDSITDGLTFYKHNNIDDSIRAISLDRRYIGICANDIVFENVEKPVIISTVDGYTKLDLPIIGTKEDITVFNDHVFSEGIVNNVQVDDVTAKAVLDAI